MFFDFQIFQAEHSTYHTMLFVTYFVFSYGERPDLSLHNRLLYSFSVPSPFLQKNNLEILITTLDYASANHELTGEQAAKAMLTPMLLAPSSATERQTAITFPVHTALVVGEGLESCINFGRLSAGQAQHSPLMRQIKFIMLGNNNAVAKTIDAASRSATKTIRAGSSTQQKISTEASKDSEFAQIDAERANEALSLFRQSAANSVAYEQGWHQAHMPQLMDWVRSQCADDANVSRESLKPAVRTLVSSVLADAHVSIGRAQARLQEADDAMLIPSATKNSLSTALDAWTNAAYKELRNKLDVAFATHAWRILSWYGIIWRADDVGVVAANILAREWLVDAEQEIIRLCGRMEEAGYYFQESVEGSAQAPKNFRNNVRGHGSGYAGTSRQAHQAPESARGSRIGSLPPSQTMSDVVRMRKDTARAQADADDSARSRAAGPLGSSLSGAWTPPPARMPDGPWPSPIPESRLLLFYETVPPLHRRAQVLIWKFAMSSGAAMMLGGLLTGVQSIGFYEAGAVALFGLAFSLRRLQTQWGVTKTTWEESVREMGRGAVRDTQALVKEILEGQKTKKTAKTGKKVVGGAGEDDGRSEEARLLAGVAGPSERALKALEQLR